ncbi:MAG: ImmA/IrrE family metallo-endopeptidase [Chloroflexota bacterium]
MVIKDIPINHDILVWARKQANLSTERAAQKAKITKIKHGVLAELLTPSLRLEQWEEGNGSPTYSQLINLAKAYRRPILTFFLSEPPKKEIHILDFRSLGNKEAEIIGSEAELSALIRQTEATQKSVREILQESNKEPLHFVGSISLQANPIEVANNIRKTLNYDLTKQSRIRTPDDLFSFIRNKAQEKGIYVIVQGNLGSHHTNMGPNVFRGFTLSDKIAPFIAINPNDTKTANVFTLAHELCHLWLGDTGISNWNSLNIQDFEPSIKNEQFCDQVAAEFLVPKVDLLRDWDLLTIGYEVDIVIKRIARQFKLSPIVIARRLLEFDKISSEDYWEWYNDYHADWLVVKEELKKRKKEPPSYKIRTRTRLGTALINTVMDATREGKISELDASLILNVKVNNFIKIM